MHRTINLQKLRESRTLTIEQLAKETGVSAESIAGAERGEGDLTALELCDLAVFFETGTADLLDSEELAVTTRLDYPGNDAYDGFWGHVGFLLHGQRHTKWYPITTTAADGVWDDLKNHEKGFIVIRTLNSRVLFVNPLKVKKILLNSDDADAPPDFEDVATYMAPASYEAIREWYWERIGGDEVPYSSKVKKLVESLLKEENLDEEKVEQEILNTFIHYRDGSSESYYADSAHLANIWALGYNVEVPVISIPEANDTFACWYSAEAVALIDTPYLELEEIRRERGGDMTSKGKRAERSMGKERADTKRKNGSKPRKKAGRTKEKEK